MQMQVEFWSDVVCPWCYLGKRRLERTLDGFEHGSEVEVVYRSFELDPFAPEDRTTPTVEMLASKYGMTSQQARDTQRQMEQRAAGEGLTFHMADLRSGNTRDAHRLLQLAKARHLQLELVERLHSAYFTEQASIFDHAELARLATDAGLAGAEAEKVLAGDEYDQDVDADEAIARSLGITGVPFYVVDRRYGISGAQPAEVIAQVLHRAWADAHAR
ncbi:MAG TPA: DsbA family oxidoreductase [Streptosporangiaceae bacterium]|nr:DsbA family oxidoreductase [Streptosporangiaceae bacterium]